MRPLPRLLETYEEARLLFEAKGWGLAKVAPCGAETGQVAIHGNCWIGVVGVKPPCGRLFRHGDICYLPVAADPKKP